MFADRACNLGRVVLLPIMAAPQHVSRSLERLMGQLSGVRATRLFGTLLHKPGMRSGSAIQNATSDWEMEGMEPDSHAIDKVKCDPDITKFFGQVRACTASLSHAKLLIQPIVNSGACTWTPESFHRAVPMANFVPYEFCVVKGSLYKPDPPYHQSFW